MGGFHDQDWVRVQVGAFGGTDEDGGRAGGLPEAPLISGNSCWGRRGISAGVDGMVARNFMDLMS